MALDGKLLARARERLAERKTANTNERDRREAAVYAAAPEIRRYDAQLRGLLGEVLDLTGGRTGAAEDFERIRQRSAALIAEKSKALEARGWPADCVHRELR